MKYLYISIIITIFFYLCNPLFSEDAPKYTQTIKGNVVNSKNLQPIVGAVLL